MIKLDKNGLVVNTITANTLINDKGESNNVSDLLVSTGDTISGNLWIDDNTNILIIGYKNTGIYNGKGGALTLYSKDSTHSKAGSFELEAADGQGRPSLIGYPDGLLSWNNSIYFNGAIGTGSASIVCDPNKSHLILGYTSDAGANLALYNVNSDNSGTFSLGAKNSDGTKIFLTGNANGSLTWASSKVITYSELNNLNGNIYWTVDNSRPSGVIGFNGNENGSNISFNSKNHTTYAGAFSVRTGYNDAGTGYSLTGTPAGILTWGGNRIMTQNSSVDMTFDPSINKEATIINSSASLIGPYFTLYANDSPTTPGCFRITARLSDTNACTLYGKPDGTLTWNGVNLKVPVGTIIALAKATSSPSGYLHCGGGEVSKTTYADLYALIGNTYGTPTDNTKFKLPNLYNKVLWGGATSSDSTYIAGTYNDAGLPNISGTISSRKTASTTPYAGGITGASGAFKFTSGGASGNSAGLSVSGSTYGLDTVNFAASNSNSIYGASSTVRPPSLNVLFYIKY